MKIDIEGIIEEYGMTRLIDTEQLTKGKQYKILYNNFSNGISICEAYFNGENLIRISDKSIMCDVIAFKELIK